MAISAWFDYNVYMANKLAQVQKADSAAGWDMVKLVKAFADAGLVGEEGAKEHFEQYGQYEDVAPNAFFNATEYYRAKAAQYYDKDPKAVTDLDVAFIEVTIKNAGSSAWSHYKQYGNSENVNPSNGFDTEAYMNAKLAALNSGATDGKVYTLPELYEAFKAAELSALEHFMLYGGSGAGEVAQKYEGKVPAEFAVPEDKKVNPGGGSGQTFNLTEGVDTFVGTAVDDTFIASVVTGDKTLTAGDTLDGGAGRDTLKVYGDAGSFTGVTVKNVETFAFSGMDYSDNYTLNAALYTGLETVTLQNITSKPGTSPATNPTFKVDNMVDGGTLGIGGAITGFVQRGDGSTANVRAIQGQFVDGATVGELAVDGLSTRTLVQFGGKNLDTVNITGTTTKTGVVYLDDGLTTGNVVPSTADDTIKTVNIKSAGGNFVLQGEKITTVDASASTGDLYLELDVAGNAVAKIVKTGAGDDQVWMDLADLNKGDAIDLGAGEDMLVLAVASGATSVTAGQYAVIKAATAETVGFFIEDTNGATTVIDAASVGGKDIFLNAKTSSAAQIITLNDVASTQTVTSELQHHDVSGSSHLVINSNEGTLGTLNVVSQTKGDTLDIDDSSQYGTLNLSGAGDVRVTSASGSSVKIDGSAMSGALEATGSDAKDFITGGSGNDDITGGGGLDILTGGAGDDMFDLSGVSGGTALADTKAQMATIMDFTKGDDTIKLGANTSAPVTIDKTAVTDFDAKVTGLLKAGTAAVTVFQYGEDTYIVNNVDTTASIAATDQIVKLDGLLDLTGATVGSDSVLTWA